MTLVAGVDSSTQSCKLEVRDADTGELVRSGHRPHPPTVPPRSEQDPHVVVGRALVVARRARARRCRDLRRRSAARHGRARRSATRPATGEALERHRVGTRGQRRSSSAWGPRRWADVIGTVPVASITITKLAWLREHEPEHFARVAHVLLPHDWLTLQLTGELCTDRGDASGTGYWSPSLEAYVPDALDLVDLDPAVAPTVLAPGVPRPARAATRSWPPAPATTWAPRSGSGSPRATSRSRSAPRAPSSRCRGTRPTTRRARWPASPTPPVGSCPLPARSTRRR